MKFDVNFEPDYGHPVKITDNIFRITAPNPGPFTFSGTNSYLIGADQLALIDPGPDNAEHLESLLKAIGPRALTHIFVSHTHKDHSPLAEKLKQRTGARIFAIGPHQSARDFYVGETNPLAESSDYDFVPDVELADHQIIKAHNEAWAIEVIHTPGHCANHACFALMDEDIMFSADHVMAWSTSIIAPPDGSMKDFMASLEKLIDRKETLYLPGHGGPIHDPKPFMKQLYAHRQSREDSILDALKRQALSIPEIVDVIYSDLDPKLHKAAGLSVLAHLEYLIERGLIQTKGAPSILGTYQLT